MAVSDHPGVTVMFSELPIGARFTFLGYPGFAHVKTWTKRYRHGDSYRSWILKDTTRLVVTL